jgi:hypothetical protein
VIYIELKKYWFRHPKVDGGDKRKHRQHGVVINPLSFFKNKESGVKTTISHLKF